MKKTVTIYEGECQLIITGEHRYEPDTRETPGEDEIELYKVEYKGVDVIDLLCVCGSLTSLENKFREAIK